jgi:aconitate hydratase
VPRRSLTQKILADHLVDGSLTPGAEIALRIDQTLTQDATGTLVMLELEALGLDHVQTDVSVQYVDHNLLQVDHKNPDDHRFLRSACRRWGLWYSRAGNGVSHPVHQQRFGRPGVTLAGSDSHTPAAGALGMLAIGAGGLDVALAAAGEPLRITCPDVWRVTLTGDLRPGVSAKDVILEMLRRHGVSAGKGFVFEYDGPGLAHLSAMDRHTIANMGTELGATSTVFPADDEVQRYLTAQGRRDDFRELRADDGADYGREETIDLAAVEPLIAMPSSPGNVRRVAEVTGRPIGQAYVGSSANPGYRDVAVVAAMLGDDVVPEDVSLDINPASRQTVLTLTRDGHFATLIAAGARVHPPGCNGCIGMGQAPATGQLSLRTVPRNFPGRSGTDGDEVALVSPETAAASALTGRITDPTTMPERIPDPRSVREPDDPVDVPGMIVAPPPAAEGRSQDLIKGANVVSIPDLAAPGDSITVPVALIVGDDISTDEILPAGAEVLPLRSNIPAIAEHCFRPVDRDYAARVKPMRDDPGGGLDSGHAVVGGANYGQGSSREHAALAPRVLGLRLALTAGFARIHRQNLVNFGVLPLTADPADLDAIERGDVLHVDALSQATPGAGLTVTVRRDGETIAEIAASHDLTVRELDVVRAGGRINHLRASA